MTLQTRQLFGGAITVALPADYLDASDMRQIPDNQEVFLSSNSDTSVIVELLAAVEEGGAKDDLWEAAKFHFNSVAHDNASLSSTIITPHPSSPISQPEQVVTSPTALQTPEPVTIIGTQVVHKFSHDPSGAARPGHESDAPDEVWIGLALWRVNVAINGVRKLADVVMTCNIRASSPDGPAEIEKTQRWLAQSAKDLKIVDWALFGDE